MGLFLIGIISSIFLGRLYCGWLCPINTAMNGVTWFKKKTHMNSLKIPHFMTRPWVGMTIFGFFIALFILTIITGNKLPILPAMFIIGIILTTLFPETLWHRYLCPYGWILSRAASKSKHHVIIDSDKCNNCSLCKNICPTEAVEKNEEHHHISKRDCLVCMKCIRKCKQKAISYK